MRQFRAVVRRLFHRRGVYIQPAARKGTIFGEHTTITDYRLVVRWNLGLGWGTNDIMPPKKFSEDR